MLLLKACGRCRGDLFVERDARDGVDLVCLQCGCRQAIRPAGLGGGVELAKTA